MSDRIDPMNEVDSGDEPMSNHSKNPHFSTILDKRLSRRQVLTGSLSAAIAGVFGAAGVASSVNAAGPALPPAVKDRLPSRLNPTLGFDAIPVTRSDNATVPDGYKVQVLIPWGTPINGNAPAYDGFNGNSGADQELQVGSHHDGMHYFPLADDPNGHGLLCLNHEYVDQNVLHVGGPTASPNGPRPADEVRKEIAAHGVSIVEIKATNGIWDVVPGTYNRRITAGTPMEIRGPVRGSDLVKTKYSPRGTMTRGTINNCANGYTPWGTYLTCEENWAGYFVNKVQLTRIDALFDALGYAGTSGPQGNYYARYDAAQGKVIGVIDETVDQKITSNVYTQAGDTLTDAGRALLGGLDNLLAANNIDIEVPREQSRYGVGTTSSRYGWETADNGADEYVRFDASIKGTATEDYRNEPNGQGWVVEIDPFDPSSTPVKRTALGRFAHEGCIFAPPLLGQPLAFYMGDDAQNEYIYKFVTRARYRKGLKGDVLDEGTLYVARFNENGTGDWLALDIEDPDFLAAATAAGVEFRDQADVLVNTRLAADVVGATKMDRPEWGAAHPQTREVYMTLTNNSSRTADNTDAPNPRPDNRTGHIIRWREQGNRAFATRFEWDIFVLAGDASNSQVLPAEGGAALDGDNIFASPDGLWIDRNGILWIQTDMSGSQQGTGPFGENQMLAANPITGEIKRFLQGPFNQETTGVVSTPDGKTLFVNFQHPGDRSGVGNFTSNWPDGGAVYRHPNDPFVTPNPNGARPRSATVVITRDDGGVVGL
ncbi:PhoX family phosphatase [Thiocapsa sp.]|uniref:PhoX family protein n=1 Tax=Thiocapsa sp. TaxID=2024551 RepID=UPI0035935A2E